MTQNAIIELLLDRGKRLFDAQRGFKEFRHVREADELLNDLQRHSHAFVLACIMDRQIRAEKAWLIPYRFTQKLGSFNFSTLAGRTLDDVRRLMTEPKPLHRFVEKMSKNFHAAIAFISDKYCGNAAAIWAGNPSSAEVTYRFLEFRGAGPKIATMAANTLARHFKIPFSDYYSIDVSVDVHVRRVFARLGLISPDNSVEAIVYRARALHPEFPGLLDFPAWEIGRNWCKPQALLCGQCYMKDLCPTARGVP